jgi:hypothetical protein
MSVRLLGVPFLLIGIWLRCIWYVAATMATGNVKCVGFVGPGDEYIISGAFTPLTWTWTWTWTWTLTLTLAWTLTLCFHRTANLSLLQKLWRVHGPLVHGRDAIACGRAGGDGAARADAIAYGDAIACGDAMQ